MKILAIIVLIVFGCAVAREVARPLLFLFTLAIVALMFAGCAAPYHYPPRAAISTRPLTCGDLPRDGSYLLLRCVP